MGILAGLSLVSTGFQSTVNIQGDSFSTTRLLLAYLAAAVLGGGILGALRRYASMRMPRILTSVAVGIVVYLSVSTVLIGVSTTSFLAGLLAGSLMGLGAGFVLFPKTNRTSPKK